MVKYIIKRILLSIVILLGVSLILYILVRLMPTDYLETKYAEQLKNKTITEEQLLNIKKDAGLYMPDAFLTIEFGEDDDKAAGISLIKDDKVSEYEDVLNSRMSANEMLEGEYYSEDEKHRLTLAYTQDSQTFVLYEKNEQGTYMRVVEGNYNATLDTGDDNNVKFDFSMSYGINMDVTMHYRVATFGEKAGAVIGSYFSWLGNMLTGDLGTSLHYNLPVAEVIANNMWVSFFIALIATVLQFLIAIPLGITSATHQYSLRDYAVTIITMMGISLPSFFFAAILIKIFSTELGWFPSTGLVTGGSSATGIAYIMDMLHHMILPMTVLVVLSIGGLMRYTRTNMLEVMNGDYIRTARAKGLSEKKVVYVHAFRNTLIPLMTLVAGILPSLFGGAMITEQVFSIDGIGRLAYQALKAGDLPFVMGYNMFLAVLTVIGTLLSDIMYAVVDPRVKLTK